MHPVAKFDGLPGFTGGLVGWFGFESIQYVEPRFADGHARDELGTPDILLMLSEEVAVFDNLKGRSEEHTSELQSLMRTSYAVFCLKKNKQQRRQDNRHE